MQAILSQHQMQAWDAYTIQHEPISSIQLMERAAQACSQWLLNKWSIATEFILLCGQGNNGGDGFAIARHLYKKNYTVHVYAFQEEGSSLDNRINRQLYYELPNSSIHDISTIKNLPANAVIIDALFGTGLNRPLEGEFVKLVQQINELHFTVVSIDVPSGMLIDNFTSSTSIIQATYTLTFQSVKKAFLFSESGSYCGEVQKLEIGLHPQFLNEILVEEQMITKNMVQQLYQTRHKFSHKGTYGHSLIIAGSNDKMGACLLAAKACLRSGTGLLTCLLTEALFPILQTAIPEAMCKNSGTFSNDDLLHFNSIAIGPGLGICNESMQLVKQVILHSNKPILLDADAISLLSQEVSLLKSLPPNSILTPHPKEFDRLFGEHKNSWERNKTQVNLSKQYSIFILLKGTYSCLTTPDGKSFFNQTGNAGMAKGGSGDALSGIICALFAQYKNMQNAAILGLYLHGLAGDFASQRYGQEAMVTSDLIDELGHAFMSLTDE